MNLQKSDAYIPSNLRWAADTIEESQWNVDDDQVRENLISVLNRTKEFLNRRDTAEPSLVVEV